MRSGRLGIFPDLALTVAVCHRVSHISNSQPGQQKKLIHTHLLPLIHYLHSIIKHAFNKIDDQILWKLFLFFTRNEVRIMRFSFFSSFFVPFSVFNENVGKLVKKWRKKPHQICQFFFDSIEKKVVAEDLSLKSEWHHFWHR